MLERLQRGITLPLTNMKPHNHANNMGSHKNDILDKELLKLLKLARLFSSGGALSNAHRPSS